MRDDRATTRAARETVEALVRSLSRHSGTAPATAHADPRGSAPGGSGGAICRCPIVSLAPARPKTWVKPPEHRGRKLASHCRAGHPMTPDNLYFLKSGERRCATCRRIEQALRSANGKNRADQERRNAPRSGAQAQRADHPKGHPPRSQKGAAWRSKGEFRSNGQKALQTARG